jgi:hypothetical protein
MGRAFAIIVLACLLVGTTGATQGGERRWDVDSLTYHQARDRGRLPLARPAAPSRASATWCGAATAKDLAPNTVAGSSVHWLYAVPSDAPDRFSTYASAMQADAESIDAWWRSQDPLRTPRSDLAELPCGVQLDLSLIRLGQSGAQLRSIESRFPQMANALIGLQFASRHTKYVVYYDGPVEPDICGEAASDSTGLGFAVVYLQACGGVPSNTTAAHELLHTLGAVPQGAPHACPAPDVGHACDNPLDIMFSFGDDTPLSGLALDSGRDDYYGHSSPWPDVQDSPWLVQLDRQVALVLGVAGPGTVAADVPGLECRQSCTTTWSVGTPLALRATPASGARLVRWGGACSGASGCKLTVTEGTAVSAFFAPATFRLTVAVSGRGSVRSSRPGVSCTTPRCSSHVRSHVPLELVPTPARGWRFARWQGACRGTVAACTVSMTAPTTARAVFVRA